MKRNLWSGKQNEIRLSECNQSICSVFTLMICPSLFSVHTVCHCHTYSPTWLFTLHSFPCVQSNGQIISVESEQVEWLHSYAQTNFVSFFLSRFYVSIVALSLCIHFFGEIVIRFILPPSLPQPHLNFKF